MKNLIPAFFCALFIFSPSAHAFNPKAICQNYQGRKTQIICESMLYSAQQAGAFVHKDVASGMFQESLADLLSDDVRIRIMPMRVCADLKSQGFKILNEQEATHLDQAALSRLRASTMDHAIHRLSSQIQTSKEN